MKQGGIRLVELKELSLHDGKEIFDMIKEIGPGENGYMNAGYNINYDEFESYLIGHIEMSKGINLNSKYVPQTMYWLYVDGKPVGITKLRHYLNENLKKEGGHIGYTIRPTERGKGYGNLILQEALKKAKQENILEVLLTCNENNTASRRVIEENGGELQDIIEGICRYWIRKF